MTKPIPAEQQPKLFGHPIGLFWNWWRKKGWESSSILKMGIGLLVMALLPPLKRLAHGAENLPDSHFEEQEGFELADRPWRVFPRSIELTNFSKKLVSSMLHHKISGGIIVDLKKKI